MKKSELNERIKRLEARVEQLERLVSEMQATIRMMPAVVSNETIRIGPDFGPLRIDPFVEPRITTTADHRPVEAS